jgi:uncharacterized protein
MNSYRPGWYFMALNQKMIARFMCLLFATALLGTNGLRADTESTIDVTGGAEIFAIPDEVLVSASIDTKGKTVIEASEQNDKLVQSVTDFLKKSGIEERHIRTEYLSLRPEFPPSTRGYGNSNMLPPTVPNDEVLQPIGYTAVRSFSIVIRDVKKFESVYKGMLQLGVNRIDGVQFRTTQLRKFRDEARTQAVKAAREKAAAMAKELGVEITGVKLISEQSSQNDPFRSNAMQVAIPVGGESSSTGGEIAITASVRVVFLIGPARSESGQ